MSDDYRYTRFRVRHLLADMRFAPSGPGPGDPLPEFKLSTTDGRGISSADLAECPHLLVFGSNTCPMTVSSIPTLAALHAEFGDRVRVVLVNVREAHPGEHFPQPETFEQKEEHARRLQQRFDIPWVVAVDDTDGSFHRALDPKPNAAYLVDTSGVIVFRSLWAADEGALREALAAVVNGQAPARSESRAMIRPMARALGHVHDVMKAAGPQAQRDLLVAAPPMAAASRTAALFSWLAPDRRGAAAMTAMGLVTLAVAVVVIVVLV